MMDDINSVFWCPQCGRGACSQEDGTCSVCGSDIILPQVVDAIATAAREAGAAEEREACAAICESVAGYAARRGPEMASAFGSDRASENASLIADTAHLCSKAIRSRAAAGGEQKP